MHNELFNDINTIIARLETVRELQQMPGWKVLRDCINDTCEKIKLSLTLEKDFNNIVRLQERYFAYNSLLEAVFSMNEELIAKRQELQEIKDQEELGY